MNPSDWPFRFALRFYAAACLLFGCLSFVSAAKVECVAGCGEGPLGGLARDAKLIEPFGIAFDKNGDAYICEYKGARITRIDKAGRIAPYAAAGNGAVAVSLNDPHGVVIAGNRMYIADTLNNRVVQIDLQSNAVNSLAGTGQAGFSGDGEPAITANFRGVYAVDVNRAGDKLFIADLGNLRVRMVDLKSGIITTAAGNGKRAAPLDGTPAAASSLIDPRAVAVDSKGTLYILERRGNALRMVDLAGRMRTLIAPASDRRSGDPGGRERSDFNGPKHICVDKNDNVIIADTENHLIRKYEVKSGRVVAIAGTGEKGNLLNPKEPLMTQLNRPHGVYVHRSGALYVCDSYNHRILKVTGWK